MTDQIVSQRKPHLHADALRAVADGIPVQFYIKGEWIDRPNPYISAEQPPGSCRVKPEKAYPLTDLLSVELFDIYAKHLREKHGYTSITAETGGLAAVANAALRHAVDADQVVPMAEVQEVARNLSKPLREKEMLAVANAVYLKCLNVVAAHSGICAHHLRKAVDLVAIMSEVKS